MPPKRASSRGSSGARNRLTFEAKVQKKIMQNFKVVSSYETDVNVVDGLTLRETLARDLKHHEEGGEPRKIGREYYRELREKFMIP